MTVLHPNDYPQVRPATVFAETPTEDHGGNERQRKFMTTIIAAILIGMLAMSSIGLYLLYRKEQGQVVKLQADLVAGKKAFDAKVVELTNAQAVIARRDETIATYGEFEYIGRLRAQAAEQRQKIDDLLRLQSKNGAPQLPTALKQEPQWRADAEGRLQKYVNDLKAHAQRVEAWMPAVQVRPTGPTVPDIRPRNQ